MCMTPIITEFEILKRKHHFSVIEASVIGQAGWLESTRI